MFTQVTRPCTRGSDQVAYEGICAPAPCKAVTQHLALTACSYDRILRTARTIADLSNSEPIQEAHLAEALTYRRSLL
ncbi:hypothetical protein [Meiothermus sp.]|uniref:magnesium chelatase subunit ChlI family protein n=1 Tax=Meiothermus sp. TaxID=1955249 RepID=UPI0026381C52|nr:hypothetical protein [Meiothermus sp.]